MFLHNTGLHGYSLYQQCVFGCQIWSFINCFIIDSGSHSVKSCLVWIRVIFPNKLVDNETVSFGHVLTTCINFIIKICNCRQTVSSSMMQYMRSDALIVFTQQPSPTEFINSLLLCIANIDFLLCNELAGLL